MNARKGFMVACGLLVCTGLTLGAVIAGEKAHKAEGKVHGKKYGKAHGEWLSAGKYAGMHSEATKAELKRFREAIAGLHEAAGDLRAEISKAVQEAKQGDENLTQALIDEIRSDYKGEARDIATLMAKEQLKHGKKMLSIATKENGATVDRLTEMLLQSGGCPKGMGNKDGSCTYKK